VFSHTTQTIFSHKSKKKLQEIDVFSCLFEEVPRDLFFLNSLNDGYECSTLKTIFSLKMIHFKSGLGESRTFRIYDEIRIFGNLRLNFMII